MPANQVSSTLPITTDSSDQMMQDGAGRLWTSLGQSPGLQMAWRRLPVFRSDMERCSAVVSLIVRRMLRVSDSSPDALHAAEGNSSRLTQLATKSLAPTEKLSTRLCGRAP